MKTQVIQPVYKRVRCNNIITKHLGEGVQMHSFVDNSGVVFFDALSAETVQISMTLQQLNTAIEDYMLLSESNKLSHVIHELFQKQLLKTVVM